MANGNQQAEGIDFVLTFCLVVKHPTVMIVLSLAMQYKWSLRQLDVSNALLHELINEDVYMR